MKDLGCRFLELGTSSCATGLPPPPGLPAPYRGTGHAFAGVTSREAGLTKWPAGLAMAGGRAPALHFSLSALGCRCLGDGGWCRRPAPELIPDRSPGHAFVPIVYAGWCPGHQGMKSRSCGLVQRIGTADSATPHPDPCGGQAPALHILIPPSATGLQVGTFRPWRAGIEVDWRAHPGSESGTCFRTNRSCSAGAGTPRYEKRVRCRLCHAPRP